MNSLLEPRVSIGVIKNEEAPDTYNDGQIIEAGSHIHLNNHIISVYYQNFFAESDVVPSYYNSWAYGNTNKKGQGIELGLQFKKYNFKIRASYSDAKLPNGVQQDQKYFFFWSGVGL